MNDMTKKYAFALVGIFLVGVLLASPAGAYAKKSWFGLYAVDGSTKLSEIDVTSSWRRHNFTEKINNDPYGDRIKASFWYRDRRPGNGHGSQTERRFWENAYRCTSTTSVTVSGRLGGSSASSSTSCGTSWDVSDGWTATDEFDNSSWHRRHFRQYRGSMRVGSQAVEIQACQDDWGPNTCSGSRYSWISW